MRPVDAEQDPGEFGAPGADEPRQPENLAGMQVEADLVGADRWTCARRLDGDHRLSGVHRGGQVAGP